MAHVTWEEYDQVCSERDELRALVNEAAHRKGADRRIIEAARALKVARTRSDESPLASDMEAFRRVEDELFSAIEAADKENE